MELSLKNGVRDGIVKIYNEKGQLELEGKYINGKINGKIKEIDVFSNQILFEGEYVDGRKIGKEYDTRRLYNF